MALSVVTTDGPLYHIAYAYGVPIDTSAQSPFTLVSVEAGDIVVVYTILGCVGVSSYRYTTVSDTQSNTYTKYLLNTNDYGATSFHVAKVATTGNLYVRTWHYSDVDGDFMWGQGMLMVLRGAASTGYVGVTSEQSSTTNNWTPTVTATAGGSMLVVNGLEMNALGTATSSTATVDEVYNVDGLNKGIFGHQSVPSAGSQSINLDAAGSSAADWLMAAIEIVPASATHTTTAPLDVTFSLTAEGSVTSAPSTWTSAAPLDMAVSLTADATVTNVADASLDVTFSLTAEASTSSDADPTWGTPETWGDLWGWWTTTAPGDNDGIVPVGFSLTAEGAAVAPTLSTAGLDVAVTLTGDSTASRSETSTLSVDFTLTADASVIPGSANAALLTLDVTLAAEAVVDTSVPSTMPLVFALAAAGSVYPFTECPDGIVCRPSTGVIDRPGPLD